MPAATTHNEFAKEVLKKLPEQFQKEMNLKLFLLGAQGPDLFFFTGSWFPSGSLARYGNEMHYKKIKEVISFMDEYSKKILALRSYFFGYLCHYALDVNAHPLICWHARKIHLETSESEDEAHFTIEAIIDLYILHRLGKNTKHYDVHHCLHITPDEDKVLGKMYQELFLKVFDYQIELSKLNHLGRNAYYVLYALKPSNIKYQVVKMIEKMAKGSKLASSVMLNGKEKLDILFEEPHVPYTLLDIETTPTRTKGFNTLYQDALMYAIQLITDLDQTEICCDFVGNPISLETKIS